MFNSIIGSSIELSDFIICLLSSFGLGLITSFVHMKSSKSNKNFLSNKEYFKTSDEKIDKNIISKEDKKDSMTYLSFLKPSKKFMAIIEKL